MSSDVKRYVWSKTEMVEPSRLALDSGIDVFVDADDYNRTVAERDAAQAEVEHWKTEVDRYRDEINTRHDKDKGNFWYWQGDGEDHLESLTCPVLIRAEDLRAIAKQLDEAAGLLRRGLNVNAFEAELYDDAEAFVDNYDKGEKCQNKSTKQ